MAHDVNKYFQGGGGREIRLKNKPLVNHVHFQTDFQTEKSIFSRKIDKLIYSSLGTPRMCPSLRNF